MQPALQQAPLLTGCWFLVNMSTTTAEANSHVGPDTVSTSQSWGFWGWCTIQCSIADHKPTHHSRISNPKWRQRNYLLGETKGKSTSNPRQGVRPPWWGLQLVECQSAWFQAAERKWGTWLCPGHREKIMRNTRSSKKPVKMIQYSDRGD